MVEGPGPFTRALATWSIGLVVTTGCDQGQDQDGSCGGFLKTGLHVDAGGVDHNKFHNTILSAVGLTNQEGAFVDDFGDPSLEPGVSDAMIAV